VLPDPGGGVKGGPPAWGGGYLPATFQGVTMRSGPQPILHLRPQPQISAAQQRATLELVQKLNRAHLAQRDNDDELSARIRAYEEMLAESARDKGGKTQITIPPGPRLGDVVAPEAEVGLGLLAHDEQRVVEPVGTAVD